MDEPTTALDVVVQRDIIERIYKLKEQFNFSVLFISHDLSMMAEFADRIAVMKEGEIVEIGKAREIWTNPQHEYTQILGKAFLSLDSAQIDTNLFKIEDAQVQEDAVLELKNVRKSFKTRKSLFKTENFDALNNINFKLKKGRALALVGESGSGKSTCAKLLSKVYPQTEGDILYHGNNIKDLKSKEQLRAYQKSVQMIFQDPFGSLNPTLTIGYHIARPLQIHRGIKDPKKLNEEIIKILDWVELSPASEMMNRYPHELSGGQRQRVAIARVLAMEPEVILADEPTSMLDVSLRVGVLDLLQKLKDELKISFLYITHDIATAKYFAEDIAVLYRGEIVEWGTSKQVTENPQHPYTRLLLNSIPDPKISIAERVASGKDPIRQIWDPQGKGCTFAQECSCGKGECAHTQSPIVQVNSEHFIREFHYTKAS
jgi:peptide/nickel transport system ATP-binding protein